MDGKFSGPSSFSSITVIPAQHYRYPRVALPSSSRRRGSMEPMLDVLNVPAVIPAEAGIQQDIHTILVELQYEKDAHETPMCVHTGK